MSKRKNIKRKYTQPKKHRDNISDKDYETYKKQYNKFSNANQMKTPMYSKQAYLLAKSNLDKNLKKSNSPEVVAAARKNMARFIASKQKMYSENQLDAYRDSLNTLKERIKLVPSKMRTAEEAEFLKEKGILSAIKKDGAAGYQKYWIKYDVTLRQYGFKISNDIEKALEELAKGDS